ncbi:MAG: ketoacyl-ACP synthase III [Clostridia bacterium]|nr:ketoacyl-ACP synthase III [Clostridia bacterium]
MPVGITGVGSYAPERVMTNAELEELVKTTDDWIRTRSGIRERRIAGEDTATSDMSVIAAQRALENAGLQASDIDLIVLATLSPDYPWPATACLVQERLGAHRAVAFDISAGCTGLVYGLAVGSQFIQTGMYRNVLVIGGETMSKVINWQDRSTCVLFGDGAGAVVLQPVQEGSGFLSIDLGTEGAGVELLYQPGGGSRRPASEETLARKEHYLHMNGREVFKFAVKVMEQSTLKAIEKAGLTVEDINYIIPHQANLRIIEAAAKRLKVGMDKIYVNVDKYGNTSAASIGIALDEALQEGKIKKGDNILLVGFGAGLTWGAIVLKW